MTKLSEPIVTSLIDILSASMPAAIAKINAEYASLDGTNAAGQAKLLVPLPGIKGYYFGEREVGPMLPDAPCIIVDVIGLSIDPERFDNNWATYDHQVSVTIIVQSDDPDILARQLLRYARAVWEVMFGNQIARDGSQVQAISVRPLRGGSTPVTRDSEESPLLYRGWVWMFEVHRYDDLV